MHVSMNTTRQKRIRLLILIVLLIVLCVWRLWGRSFLRITSINVESLSEIRGLASFVTTENGDLKVSTYDADFFKEDEGWDEILRYLTSANYRQDLRNPFLFFINKISFNRGRRDLTVTLYLWEEEQGQGCEICFVSNNLIYTTPFGSYRSSSRPYQFFHPTDKTIMDKLAEIIQKKGEIVSSKPEN